MTITVDTNIKTVSPVFILSPPIMLENVTLICYVSYHIRNKKKNQLKIQKTFWFVLEKLT
ncbi:hypothetical protein CON07_18120 [Bacillus sp. AFS094611]|uniref:Uncharacterized protein n=1 Tax=Bacillus anthracis TaxID=1392 RepID=A0A2A7DDH9_BACAN|nr:hypothetical protein CON16_06070 [Bacillus anthracis]PDZ49896.1 hypothetical protein CON07_18120 [Bacillus sp. AFS094611]